MAHPKFQSLLFAGMLLLLVAGFLAWPSAVHAKTPEASATMIILDASGSMWGQVRGETKIVAARKAVRGLLETWPAGRELGLMAYGHRRKGDCADIEIIAPIGTIDPATLSSTVDQLNAKGKTPITDAVREAAKAARSTEVQTTMILISDGIETCGGDPCALARELEASGVNFTAHVIGFDVADPAAKAQLQCMADVTGGIYRDAADGAGLSDALLETADAEGGAAKAPVVEDVDLEHNLRGVARLSDDSDPLGGAGSDVHWRILRASDRTEQYSSAKSALYHAVTPGDWIVEASYGEAKAEVPVTVEPGKVANVDIILNAGSITATLTQKGLDPAKAQNLTWKIFKSTDLQKYFVVSYDTTPTYFLPAGDYEIQVTKDDLATASQKFVVVAGDPLDLSVDLKAGTLRYNLPGAFIAQVRTADDATNVANLDVTGEKTMNPGEYLLRVTYEGGKSVDRLFKIVDGETLEITLTQ